MQVVIDEIKNGYIVYIEPEGYKDKDNEDMDRWYAKDDIEVYALLKKHGFK